MTFKIKNYTTSIPWQKTVMEIEYLLAEFGAEAVMKEYRGDGRIESLSFKITTKFGVRGFKLPANTESVKMILTEQKLCPHSKVEEQAEKTAWRIIKDWLHAQISLVKVGIAEPEQIMLPYMAGDGGKTLYEIIENRQLRIEGDSYD